MNHRTAWDRRIKATPRRSPVSLVSMARHVSPDCDEQTRILIRFSTADTDAWRSSGQALTRRDKNVETPMVFTQTTDITPPCPPSPFHPRVHASSRLTRLVQPATTHPLYPFTQSIVPLSPCSFVSRSLGVISRERGRQYISENLDHWRVLASSPRPGIESFVELTLSSPKLY
jgi:hypothetical protein